MASQKGNAILIRKDSLEKEYRKDLFRYRELLYFFAWRECLVRYRQTALGVIWAIVRPIVNMVVFAFVFGKIAQLPSEGLPYPLFILSGMIPWHFFASCIHDTNGCLIQHASLISKVYFPRILVPFTHLIVNSIDYLIGIALLLIFIPFWFGIHFKLFLLPLFTLHLLFISAGVSLWVSAITTRYRDIRFIAPFIVQIGLFLSPVAYGSDLIPKAWMFVYFLNPIAGVIEGMRWCWTGVFHPFLPLAISLSLFSGLFLFWSGFRYFRKMETLFADLL